MRDRIHYNGEGVPIVALDIDGTLGNYHNHFLRFAENWFGTKMPHADEINPGDPLYKFMGVSLGEYRECKLAYRQGGLKRWMPAYPGADRLTLNIRTAGAEVWLCTTRPYLRLDNIDPDTREWLRRNSIHYDGILFEPIHAGSNGKYGELKRQANGRVAAIVDDLPEQLEVAHKVYPDIPIFIRDQQYNRHIKNEEYTRVYSCGDIWQGVVHALLEWREKQRV